MYPYMIENNPGGVCRYKCPYCGNQMKVHSASFLTIYKPTEPCPHCECPIDWRGVL